MLRNISDDDFYLWLLHEKRFKTRKLHGRRKRILYHGYIHVLRPNHPFATKQGYVKEHRLVWEYYNKAILMPWACVRHINKDPMDNRYENLEIVILHPKVKKQLKSWLPEYLEKTGI